MAFEGIGRLREKDLFTQLGYLAFLVGAILTICGMALPNFSSNANLWDYDHSDISDYGEFVAVRACIAIGFALCMATFVWMIFMMAGIKIPCISSIIRFFAGFPAIAGLLIIIGMIIYHAAKDEMPGDMRDCDTGCILMWIGAALVFICACLFQKGDGPDASA